MARGSWVLSGLGLMLLLSLPAGCRPRPCASRIPADDEVPRGAAEGLDAWATLPDGDAYVPWTEGGGEYCLHCPGVRASVWISTMDGDDKLSLRVSAEGCLPRPYRTVSPARRPAHRGVQWARERFPVHLTRYGRDGQTISDQQAEAVIASMQCRTSGEVELRFWARFSDGVVKGRARVPVSVSQGWE